MKKQLISMLVAAIITPTISSEVTTINCNMNINKDKNQHQLSNKNVNNEKGIDWNKVQKTIDDAVDNPQNSNLSSQGNIPSLTSDEKKLVKSTTSKSIDNLKAANVKTSAEVNQYLKANNADYKKAMNHPETVTKDFVQKIILEYFNGKAIDLNLDGENTYQDAINVLTKKIKSEYGADANNLILKLSDNKLANKSLFDDTNDSSIRSFVNNTISAKVEIQNNQDETKTETLTFKNLQLKNQKFLDEAVASYFESTNKNDLQLGLNDTRKTAFNKVLDLIKERFSNYQNNISLKLSNPGAMDQTFANKDIVQDVMNENAWIGVTFSSPTINKDLQFYPGFNLNFTDMSFLISNTFLTNGNNPQYLSLTTDNTFQDAINRLNSRIQELSPNFKFSVDIQSADNNERLGTEFDPSKETQNFSVKNAVFSFIDDNDGKKYNIGNGNVYLGDVQLSPQDQDLQKEYNALILIDKDIKNAIALDSTAQTSAYILAGGLWTLGVEDIALWELATSVTETAGTLSALSWGLSMGDYAFNSALQAIINKGVSKSLLDTLKYQLKHNLTSVIADIIEVILNAASRLLPFLAGLSSVISTIQDWIDVG